MGECIKRLKLALKSCVAGRRSGILEGDEDGKESENQGDEVSEQERGTGGDEKT